MQKDYDEVIAEMLIQLDQIEKRMLKADKRMEKFDKRLDLTIKRMVKAEQRMENTDKRMELFDKRLEQSLKDQKQFSQVQSKVNQNILNHLAQTSKVIDHIIRKNNLKV